MGVGGLHNSSTEPKFNLLSAIIKTGDESELAVVREGEIITFIAIHQEKGCTALTP